MLALIIVASSVVFATMWTTTQYLTYRCFRAKKINSFANGGDRDPVNKYNMTGFPVGYGLASFFLGLVWPVWGPSGLIILKLSQAEVISSNWEKDQKKGSQKVLN
jgi:hypothetical protein